MTAAPGSLSDDEQTRRGEPGLGRNAIIGMLTVVGATAVLLGAALVVAAVAALAARVL